MKPLLNRRQWLLRTSAGGAGFLTALERREVRSFGMESGGEDGTKLARETFEFILRCRREDGSYAPSPDPGYAGESDTKLSDLAAVTYASVLAKTMGWKLPEPKRSAQFIAQHQREDGQFVNQGGRHDADSALGVLYNTTQGVVALRALGERPRIDPTPVIDQLLAGEAYKKLPWYTTSFFPLLCAALDRPFPDEWRKKLTRHMEASQADDGYLGDHVAATFHMAHFYRLIGQPTPKADRMVARVLRDQKPDGGWNIKQPDWDVHSCFDAIFILRQLGGDGPKVRTAINKGADWALGCRNRDGGFGHFPGRPSDMDAFYFQFGALIQAGLVPGVRRDLPDAHTLGWGHAMEPGTRYSHLTRPDH